MCPFGVLGRAGLPISIDSTVDMMILLRPALPYRRFLSHFTILILVAKYCKHDRRCHHQQSWFFCILYHHHLPNRGLALLGDPGHGSGWQLRYPPVHSGETKLRKSEESSTSSIPDLQPETSYNLTPSTSLLPLYPDECIPLGSDGATGPTCSFWLRIWATCFRVQDLGLEALTT